jgi:hypothetical protein
MTLRAFPLIFVTAGDRISTTGMLCWRAPELAWNVAPTDDPVSHGVRGGTVRVRG